MDLKTEEFFETYTPEYSLQRYDHLIERINSFAKPDSSLIDIGCGIGNILEYIKIKTPIRKLCGMDVSKNCLDIAQQRVGCDLVHGSILDSDIVTKVSERYDFAMLGSILHHLIGKSRKESWSNARQAIANTLEILKDDGILIIFEQKFQPYFIHDVVFTIKTFTTSMTSKRIAILNQWYNIGAPVVSYYSEKQLLRMIDSCQNCSVVDLEIRQREVPRFSRITGLGKSANMEFVVKKIMGNKKP